MGIHILNPPDPQATPTSSGLTHSGGKRCGKCPCVPKWWRLVPGASRNFNNYQYVNDMVKEIYLPRAGLPSFIAEYPIGVDDIDCYWELRVGGSAQVGTWSIYTTGEDEAVPFGWAVNLNWTYIVSGTPVPDNVQYFKDEPFNCLKPNLFNMNMATGGYDAIYFPLTVTLIPFWP